MPQIDFSSPVDQLFLSRKMNAKFLTPISKFLGLFRFSLYSSFRCLYTLYPHHTSLREQKARFFAARRGTGLHFGFDPGVWLAACSTAEAESTLCAAGLFLFVKQDHLTPLGRVTVLSCEAGGLPSWRNGGACSQVVSISGP